MTVRIAAGAATDVGRVRSINQDSFLVLDERGLYVVADGMGGHQGGEVASQLAVAAMRSTYVEGAVDALADAIEEANVRIHEQGEADPTLQGMGTTVVALAIVPDEQGDETTGSLLVANVGDSRAYLYRDGELTQLTEDHSMVADLLRAGRITEAEAEVHPQRNIVTRVLGVYDQVDIDLWPVDAVEGDRIVLCSDGLFNEVAKDQIAAVLRRLADPQEAASELVRRALDGGGRDNVTVVVLDVVDDGGVAEAASAGLAGAASGLSSDRLDLAGFSTARDDDTQGVRAVADEPSRRAKRRAAKGDRASLRSRFTWRVAVFLVVLVALFGGAIVTVRWYGTHAWYVGVDEANHVVLVQGRPDEVPLTKNKVLRTSAFTLPQVEQTFQLRISAGNEQVKGSRAEAERFFDTIEAGIEDGKGPPVDATGAVTTTTTSTSTTLPVDPSTTTSVG